MQRILVYLFAQVFAADFFQGRTLSLELRPHKVRRVKNVVVKDCKSNRDALILSASHEDPGEPDVWQCYAYIG